MKSVVERCVQNSRNQLEAPGLKERDFYAGKVKGLQEAVSEIERLKF